LLGEKKPILVTVASEERTPFTVSAVIPRLTAPHGEAAAVFGVPSITPPEPSAKKKIVFMMEPLERGIFTLFVEIRAEGRIQIEKRTLVVG
jgi:hypothetical protein